MLQRMPSRFLSRAVQGAVLLASLAAATTVVTVNGIASHAIPPFLCKSWMVLFLLMSLTTLSRWSNVRGVAIPF